MIPLKAKRQINHARVAHYHSCKDECPHRGICHPLQIESIDICNGLRGTHGDCYNFPYRESQLKTN